MLLLLVILMIYFIFKSISLKYRLLIVLTILVYSSVFIALKIFILLLLKIGGV